MQYSGLAMQCNQLVVTGTEACAFHVFQAHASSCESVCANHAASLSQCLTKCQCVCGET
jgi:phosphoribosylaminoimidazole (AIR) synthetase